MESKPASEPAASTPIPPEALPNPSKRPADDDLLHPDATAAKRQRMEHPRPDWADAASAQLRRIPIEDQSPPELYEFWDHELDIIIAFAFHAGRRTGKWCHEARECTFARTCGECLGCTRKRREANRDDGGDIVQLVQRAALLGLIGHHDVGTTLADLPVPPHRAFSPHDARWRRAAHVDELRFRQWFSEQWADELYRRRVPCSLSWTK